MAEKRLICSRKDRWAATPLTASIDLVRQAQAGDGQALDGLCERYYDRVLRIVRLRIGPRLRSLCESVDIVQDTFVEAVKAFDQFDVKDEASLIQWLSKLAENQIRHTARRYSAQKRTAPTPVRSLSPRTDPGLSAAPAHPGATPTEDVSRAEQAAIVEACIGDLPDDYREVIIMRDYAGASWEHVARETGRPSADAARKMHAQALRHLDRLVRRRTSV